MRSLIISPVTELMNKISKEVPVIWNSFKIVLLQQYVITNTCTSQ